MVSAEAVGALLLDFFLKTDLVKIFPEQCFRFS